MSKITNFIRIGKNSSMNGFINKNCITSFRCNNLFEDSLIPEIHIKTINNDNLSIKFDNRQTALKSCIRFYNECNVEWDGCQNDYEKYFKR